MLEPGDRPGENPLRQLRLYLYLLPILGIFPAVWQLYWAKGDRREQSLARRTLILTFSWLGLYLGLGWGGAHLTGISGFRIAFFNALLTSGYFLTCLFLMVQVWQKSTKMTPPDSEEMTPDLEKYLLK